MSAVVVGSTVATIMLASFLVLSAARKLSHREDVVRSYLRVGVPEDRLNTLAAILVAGAAGLVAGLVWPPIGVAAAAGLVCYFAVAACFHIRAHDARNLPTPVTVTLIAALVLALHVATV